MNSGMKGIFVKSASVPRNAAAFTAPRLAAARRGPQLLGRHTLNDVTCETLFE